MPALILLIPLIAGILDQTGYIPAIPLHRKHAHKAKPIPYQNVISYELPDKTEVIYFVQY